MLMPEMRAISSPLPLLVARVGADHEHPPVAADDLALLAHRLDRRSYFHARSVSLVSSFFSSAGLWRPLQVSATPLKPCSQHQRLRLRAHPRMVARWIWRGRRMRRPPG